MVFMGRCAALATSSVARWPVRGYHETLEQVVNGQLGVVSHRPRVSGAPRSSQLHSSCPSLILLLPLIFLLRHLLLVFLLGTLQLVRNDGTNTPQIVIVNPSRRTTELFSRFCQFSLSPKLLWSSSSAQAPRVC
jgi:hypothetical protein